MIMIIVSTTPFYDLGNAMMTMIKNHCLM